MDSAQWHRSKNHIIRGIKLVTVPVADQDRALTFYTEKLGFRVLTDQPFDDKQRWLELGIPGADTRLVLFRFGETFKPGMFMNFTFWTDDVEATIQDLRSKGVKITME